MSNVPVADLRMRVPLIWRAAFLLAVTVVVFVWANTYDQAMIRAHSPLPAPSFLGSTWYGPFLTMLIPASLFWLSIGARRMWARMIGLALSVFVLLICLYLIWIGMSANPESLPFDIPRHPIVG